MPELFGPAGMIIAISWIVRAHTGYFQGSNVLIKRSNVPCNLMQTLGRRPCPVRGLLVPESLRIFLMLP